VTATRKLFIPDSLSADALSTVRDLPGVEVDYRPNLGVEEKLAAVADAEAVIVRSATQVDARFLEAARSLRLVVRAGVGVDNVDVGVATRRGIVVQNVPDGNTRSAAEHTIALILALARNIPEAHRSMREGKWERTKYVGVEVRGKTLGVIGLGKIGRFVVDMAKGLGFKILAYDPFVAPRMAEDLGVELIKDVGELASRSDFLTVHVPKSKETAGLIGHEVLSRAKKGIRVINCARGGIVDETALLEAIGSGIVAGAALDVFDVEPPTRRDVVDHPKIIVTPHLGASTHEAQENVAVDAARQVADFFTSGKLHSPVNAVSLDPALRDGVEPYARLAYSLGRLHAQLLEGNPERVVVKCYGKVFEPKVQSYMSSMVLEGFLRNRSEQPINSINARLIAQEQGLAVEERDEGQSSYFVDMLKVEVRDSAGAREVGGAIRGRRGLRLVSLDAYHFDAVLEGTILLTANVDRRGMIGAIGQVLASNDANISNMTLGRDRRGGTALAVINVDTAVPEKALRDLEAIDGILWAKSVDVS
jgi:D-3-phosphoglycerate dehydrogenase